MKLSSYDDNWFLPWQAWVLNGFYACSLIVLSLWIEPSFHQRLSSFWLDDNEVFVRNLELTQTVLVTTQQNIELTYYLNRKLVSKEELAADLSSIAENLSTSESYHPLIALDLDPASTIESQQELLKIIQKLKLKAVLVSLR